MGEVFFIFVSISFQPHEPQGLSLIPITLKGTSSNAFTLTGTGAQGVSTAYTRKDENSLK